MVVADRCEIELDVARGASPRPETECACWSCEHSDQKKSQPTVIRGRYVYDRVTVTSADEPPKEISASVLANLHIREVTQLDAAERMETLAALAGVSTVSAEVGRRLNLPSDLRVYWWALRGSNPRPSPCKGDALPAELSARFRGRVTARTTHHVAELDRQPRAAAGGAPVKAIGPSRLRLTRRADQHLPPAGHPACPRHRTLVGVVGRAAASPACRSIHRLVGSVERPHAARIQGHAGAFPHVD